MQLLCYLVLLSVISSVSETLAARCPINSPLLPAPKTLSASPFIHSAGEKLKELFDSAVAGSIIAGWQTNVTSFSIILTDAESSLWEYHHTAPGNVNSTKNVNGDTQFLIASISKVFTDLALLKVGLDLDDPITKYLPELASNDSSIKWEDITLRALGNHLAGIPQSYGYPDDYTAQSYLEPLGFPPLSESDYPLCGVIGLHPACTKQQLLTGLLTSVPIFPPNTRPVYSSISFTLLGYVLEEVTGKTFGEILDTEIIGPLGMQNTGLHPTNQSSGVIPPVTNVWGVDFQDNSPGSGVYSTSNDLTRLVQGILSLSVLSTPSDVRGWLKPMAETASLYNLVGMPWEITRATNLTPENPHIIDIYAKDGHVPGYTSRMAMINEYGVGFTILTAGLTDAINPLTEALLSVFVPAIEEATRDEAKIYVGSFSTPTNSTIQSYLTLEIDDGPGLKITGFISNSTDMLAGISTMWGFWPGNFGASILDFRLYPADISQNTSSDGTTGTIDGISAREDWRMLIEPLLGSSVSQLPSQKVYDNICTTLQSHDTLYYGGKPVDRFLFLKEGDDIIGIEIPFLRISLVKQ